MEIWKISISDSKYEVSNYGRVRRLYSYGYKYRKLQLTDKGYYKIGLSNGVYFVHRLVAELFCSGKSALNCVINHIDGNRTNNNFSNLEWTTIQGNNLHSKTVLRTVPYHTMVHYDANGNFIKEYPSLKACIRAKVTEKYRMRKDLYSVEAALSRLNRARKKHVYKEGSMPVCFSKSCDPALRNMINNDYSSGILIKDICLKYGVSRYKVSLVLEK